MNLPDIKETIADVLNKCEAELKPLYPNQPAIVHDHAKTLTEAWLKINFKNAINFKNSKDIDALFNKSTTDSNVGTI
jgi:hypothetical protein